MSIVQRLTENIVERDLKKEGAALLNKWERTGLLEGLNNEITKNSMARLLENQAKELLREASTMSGGDVEGFAAVAFPIVRRVFGGLIANDLVSVQPMSLPSGLIFFLDFTYSNTQTTAGAVAGKSVYGGDRVASQITGGVDLTGSNAEKSFYALNNAYSNASGTVADIEETEISVGRLDGTRTVAQVRADLQAGLITTAADREVAAAVAYDADLDENLYLKIVTIPKSSLTVDAGFGGANRYVFDENNLISIVASAGSNQDAFADAGELNTSAGNTAATQVRRLTRLHGATRNAVALVFTLPSAANVGVAGNDQINVTFAIKDDFDAGTAVGSVVGDLLPLEGAGKSVATNDVNAEADVMREIDIKVDSIAVTAQTRKLKAKWSPELGQDLNAYHNLDAEVELTSILSEHIALEIDREILTDLVQGATAGTFHWSRAPGLFLNKFTGKELGAAAAAPDFTGNVSMWYETLIETINDVSAQIHRKTLRGGANFVVCSPEVANVLEFTGGFKASVTADADRGTIGAVKVGSLSQKFEVFVDPYFVRNVVLVGRKGNSFLESGYVYAPYVPLQVTPTIFGTEDFVPRKGVMTRYAKKMVRPDMYGLVIVHDLLGGEGAS
jgi:hypothetical protein